ncbi:MAG: cell wall-active antibiotics response protein LiaF [Chloroflexota bacterium]|nr:cell wall-active antibiotics response protein LiaF [Chloroflexota bacterium]
MTYGRWWEVLLGTIVTALGVLFLLDNLGVLSAGQALAISWPLALVFLGLFIMWGSGHWRGVPGGLEKAVGNVRIGPGEWDLRDMDTRIGVGELRLDLSRARIPEGETSLRVSGGIGKIEILVPASLAISARGEVGAGSISLLGHKADGISRQLSFASPDYATAARKVKIDMSLFLGEASIVRVE